MQARLIFTSGKINPLLRNGWILLSAFAIFLACRSTVAQTISIFQLNHDVIETRLMQFSPKNEDRKTRLQQLFESAGCPADHLQEQKVQDLKLPNIICTLPGKTDSIIIVGAHYDYDSNYGNGVIDNWSGASLLPSLLESLHNVSRNHTYVFIGFSGEERGLVGSRYYVKQLHKDQKSKIRAMVGLDCLGLGGTEVELNRGDKGLIKLLNFVANGTNLPLVGMNVERVGMTDAYSFMDAKIPAVSIHTLTDDTLGILHSLRDRIDAIKMENYYDTYLLVAYYLAALDQREID